MWFKPSGIVQGSGHLVKPKIGRTLDVSAGLGSFAGHSIAYDFVQMRRFDMIACLLLGATNGFHAAELHFEIQNEDGQLLPCRIHLFDQNEKPQRAAGLPFWRDHFVCPGVARLDLPPGQYRYEIERGPEHERLKGEVAVSEDSPGRVRRRLERIAQLRSEGWFSGDLHIHRPLSQISLLMRAEDLDFAPVITWWNRRNQWEPGQHAQAGEDEREGGALLFHRMSHPIDITKSSREMPSPLAYVDQARRQHPGVWIDIEKPFWWDVPVWLASGKMQSIGVANNHMWRSRMLPTEAWGRARDAERLPPPLGNGFWTQEIYYHILNTGIRIPPSAGSASGVLGNPLGYNRVYVHLDGEFSEPAWWDSLAKGRCFVTNGPLLRVRANGRLPGAVFQSQTGKSLALKLDVQLTTLDRLAKLEVIQNGSVTQTIPCNGESIQAHSLEWTASESGWFLVRGIAENQETFRFASSGPFYVELGQEKRRISKASSRFFLDWVNERIERVKGNVRDQPEQDEVLRFHESARKFWQERVRESNAD